MLRNLMKQFETKTTAVSSFKIILEKCPVRHFVLKPVGAEKETHNAVLGPHRDSHVGVFFA